MSQEEVETNLRGYSSSKHQRGVNLAKMLYLETIYGKNPYKIEPPSLQSPESVLGKVYSLAMVIRSKTDELWKVGTSLESSRLFKRQPAHPI
jgi:hypothetical protein